MSRYFTQDHEWIDIAGDVGTVGITDYAQGQLGDITFVELPEPGRRLKAAESAAVVDSVKAASDVYCPVSGEVTDANDALEDRPELVNEDAEKGGWLFRVKLADPTDLEDLMNKAEYDEYVAGL